jgi:hypothetical protein
MVVTPLPETATSAIFRTSSCRYSWARNPAEISGMTGS